MSARVRWVLAVLAIVLGSLGPARAGAQEATDPGELELVSSTPWVAPDGEITFVIRTRGDSSASVARIEIHRPVTSAGALDEALAGDTGRALYASPPIPIGFVPVEADGTRELQVSVSPTESGDLTARLPTPGVHPVTLTLADPDGTVRTTEHTAVVRLGTDERPLPAPALAVLVDVAVDPTVGPDGARDLSAPDVARLARVQSFLDGLAGPGAPTPSVTVAVVPDSLDALTASSDPRAAEIVDALVGLGPDHLALGLPYVPLAAQALLDAGLGGFLPDLVTLGRSQLDDRLTATIDPSTWSAEAPLAPDGAAALAELGVRRLVVPGPADARPDDPDRPLLAAGPHPLAGLEPLVGVAVDATTTQRLLRPGDPAIALAELIVRTPDLGPTPTVVLRVDDVPEDAVLRRLAPLLADPSSPVPLGGLELVPDTPAPGTGPLDPALGPPVEGLDAVAAEVRAVDAAVDTFAQTVAGQSARAVDLRLRVATSLAASLTTDERRALLAAAAAEVDTAFDGLFLGGQIDLNLTSRRGTLPLELHNETGFPVKVVVTVRSERLLFPEGDRFEIVLDEEITRFDVPVEARATGSVPTFVTMTTPDGTVRLDMRQLNVRSTAISGVGLLLSIGALAVLLVWWGRSWWRGRSS